MPAGDAAQDGPSPEVQGELVRLVRLFPEAVALLSPRGRVHYLNDAALQLAGAAVSAARGCLLEQVQPGWVCALLYEEGIPAALREGSWRGETAMLRADGSELPAEQTLLALGTPEAPLLASVVRDLSVRKAIALERLEAMNGYDAAIRGSGLVYFRWHVATGVLTYQGDVAALTGYSEPELAGGWDRLHRLVHLDDVAHVDREMQRAASTRGSLEVEFRLQRPVGDFVLLRARGAFFLDRHGELAHLAGFLSDETAQRQIQEQLAAAKAKLEQRLQSRLQEARSEATAAQRELSELLSRVSHELRTPLNAILGFTQLLEMEPTTPRQAESLEHIGKAGRHLLSLINEVLQHSGTTNPLSAPVQPAPEAAPAPRRFRLLYVEDEVLNVELMKRVVDNYPEYELICTNRGADCVPQARECQPDLILLDLNLPDLSGETVLEQLKADRLLQRIPVIMVSADVMGARIERLLAAGALTYLTKPFRISDFLAVIREALEPKEE